MGLVGKIFLASFPILMSMYAAQYREEDRLNFLHEMEQNLGLPQEEKFDFIIVGGGTAGCVLANGVSTEFILKYARFDPNLYNFSTVARRLSDAQFTVLLLEAGGTPPPPQAAMSGHIFRDNEFNFGFRSTPQSHAGRDNEGIVNFGPAKMLGGGSSHNEMLYDRGHPRGYDEWAKMTSDPSWSYKELLKYFLKAENYMSDSASSNVGQHGVGGPMTVTQPKDPEKVIELFFKAGVELGYPTKIDINGPQSQGFGRMQFTRDSMGRRVSTYTAYVKPIEADPHSKLTVRRYSIAQKIIFENKTAVGVTYTRHGVPRITRATKEVILSAGTFISPILLIRSGVGPQDQLRLAQVDQPVSILPVGYNFIDRLGFKLNFDVDDKSYLWNVEDNLTSSQVTNYLEQGTGILAPGRVAGYIDSHSPRSLSRENDKNDDGWPDLFFMFSKISTCDFLMTRPLSRGRISLNASATGMEDDFLPIVDSNYYGDERDFDTTIYGIETCLKIFEQTAAFKKVGGRYAEGPIRGCDRLEFKSREYWKCYLRHKAKSLNQSCCSNRMGPAANGNSVVDPKFRVFGVNNLRVVDASSMPTIPSGNMAAPVVAVAEKASDIIVQHYMKNIA